MGWEHSTARKGVSATWIPSTTHCSNSKYMFHIIGVRERVTMLSLRTDKRDARVKRSWAISLDLIEHLVLSSATTQLVGAAS